jgi:nucleotide-binding universal stress UspA family protein
MTTEAYHESFAGTGEVVPFAVRSATSLHPKTITVFLDGSASGERRAAQAAALARRWNAHLVGVHVMPVRTKLQPSHCYAVGHKAIDQVIGLAHRLRSDADTAARLAGEAFTALCRETDVDGEFRLIAKDVPAEEAILNSLHSDMVVVGHPEPNGLPDGMAQERLLLSSGAPLLVIPNDWQGDTIGRNVLIAWNGSREARRAVSDAIALLVAADSVTVLVIDAADRRAHGEEPGADLATLLVRHGAHVSVLAKASHGAPVAELILRTAAEIEADLLVFGAYSHRRARELLLGGATRTLFTRMPVPVFVSR